MSNAVIITFLQCSRNDDIEDGYLKEFKRESRTKNLQEPKK